MNDHIPDPTKMISDTPRTQARVRYMIDNNISPEGLEHWANGLERELNAANVEIDEKRKDIVYIATEKAKLENRIERLEEELMDMKNKHAVLVADVALYEDRAERIKRLEEAGDVLAQRSAQLGLLPMAIEGWHKAKEAKP